MGEIVFVVRRRVGERILIADEIEIEIVEISKTRVKLGVRAPREVPVVRAETVPVAAENRAASAWASSQAAAAPAQLMKLLQNLQDNSAQTVACVSDQ